MLLKKRLLVAMVVFLAHWAAEIREPDGRLHLLQPCERKSEFEIQATGNVRQPTARSLLGTYVSMIEQCQNARRVRSACPQDEALGWLGRVSYLCTRQVEGPTVPGNERLTSRGSGRVHPPKVLVMLLATRQVGHTVVGHSPRGKSMSRSIYC